MSGGRMRIGLLAGWYYPDSTGGTESYVRSLARDLRSAGHCVEIAAPSVDGQLQQYDHDGVRVFRFPISITPSRALIRNEIPPPALGTFEQWLDEWRPDLVHMHSITGSLGVYHARAVKRRDIPLVVTAHVPGLFCPRGTLMRWGHTPCDGRFSAHRCGACCLQERGLPQPLAWPVSSASATPLFRHAPGRIGTTLQYANGLGRNHDRTLELLGLADRIVIVCEWLRAVMHQNDIPDDKLVLSRHGLPADYPSGSQSDRRSTDTLRIGYLGRFDPMKGVHVLIEAFRKIPRALPIELHLRGVAVAAQEGYLASLQESARNDPRIVFGGPLTDAERHAVMSTWHVLAVPSIGFETGPLVVLEAFAAGIPVMGSCLGGIAELVPDGEAGILLPPNDIDAWTRAMEGLAQRFRAGDWRWRLPAVRSSMEVCTETVALYQAALSEHHLPRRAANGPQIHRMVST